MLLGRSADVVPRDTPSAVSAAGIPVDIPQDAAERSRRLATFDAQRHSTLSSALAALRGLHVRPELDSDRTGRYMRNAIDHGGYRAALEYYSSDDAKASHTEQYLFRIRGWLLGRLGLYDQVTGWLEEAAALPTSDHFLDDYDSCTRAAYRTPAMWLETPRPVRRSADRILTLEPAVQAGPDAGAVPDYIWSTMLILDAAGPICSHAGLGAAAFLAEAGADRPISGAAGGDRRYDPLRGARLHGAPEGCHRWIIADIDFDPWAVGRPHYYYDLTDEGRRALCDARSAGAPWPRAVEAATSGLGGKSLPDLLESACRLGSPREDLGEIRGKLAMLISAWDNQEKGAEAAPVSAEDRTLVDLGEATNGPDSDVSAGSALDHLFCLMAVLELTHEIACEAEPHSNAEKAVLEVLIGALRDQCRKHAGAVATATSRPRRGAASSGGVTVEGDGAPRRPLYADVAPALICDLYYCLTEYCGSRRLAVDPCALPSEQLTAEEKDAMAKAFEKRS